MFDKLNKYIDKISVLDDNWYGERITAGVAALDEIETNLFSLVKEERNVYFERVLYRIFKDKKYLLELKCVEFYDRLYEIEAYHRDTICPSIEDDQVNEIVLVKRNIDFHFIATSIYLFDDLIDLCGLFGIKYDEKKYPIKDLMLMRDDINALKEKDISLKQPILSEYNRPDLTSNQVGVLFNTLKDVKALNKDVERETQAIAVGMLTGFSSSQIRKVTNTPASMVLKKKDDIQKIQDVLERAIKELDKEKKVMI